MFEISFQESGADWRFAIRLVALEPVGRFLDPVRQDPKDQTGQKIEYAYQNSWGLTQRTIGVMAWEPEPGQSWSSMSSCDACGQPFRQVMQFSLC